MGEETETQRWARNTFYGKAKAEMQVSCDLSPSMGYELLGRSPVRELSLRTEVAILQLATHTSQSTLGTKRGTFASQEAKVRSPFQCTPPGSCGVPQRRRSGWLRQLEGRWDGEGLPSVTRVCVPAREEKGKQIRFLDWQDGIADKGTCRQI